MVNLQMVNCIRLLQAGFAGSTQPATKDDGFLFLKSYNQTNLPEQIVCRQRVFKCPKLATTTNPIQGVNKKPGHVIPPFLSAHPVSSLSPPSLVVGCFSFFYQESERQTDGEREEEKEMDKKKMAAAIATEKKEDLARACHL